MACMLKRLGPAPASALRTAPLHSLMDYFTHILSFHLPLPLHPFCLSFSVTSLLHPPVVCWTFPPCRSLCYALVYGIYIYMSCAQKPIFFPSLRHVVPVLHTTPACAIKASLHDSFLFSDLAPGLAFFCRTLLCKILKYSWWNYNLWLHLIQSGYMSHNQQLHQQGTEVLEDSLSG